MKANNTPEVIESIELSKLHPFPDHPFAVRDDDTIENTDIIGMVREYGFSPDELMELIKAAKKNPIPAPADSDETEDENRDE